MSRSRRKHPITGTCVCRSEKSWKRLWHSLDRAVMRHRIATLPLEQIEAPHKNEVSDVWDFGKDGKSRHDPIERPDIMRK